jgi:hypothetical protein
MQQKLLEVASVNISITAPLALLIRYFAFLRYLVGWITQELINQILAVSREFVFFEVSRPAVRPTQPATE